MASEIETAMKAAGFAQIELHELALDPVPAICVTGVKGWIFGHARRTSRR